MTVVALCLPGLQRCTILSFVPGSGLWQSGSKPPHTDRKLKKRIVENRDGKLRKLPIWRLELRQPGRRSGTEELKRKSRSLRRGSCEKRLREPDREILCASGVFCGGAATVEASSMVAELLMAAGIAVGGLLLCTGVALGLAILCHPVWLVRRLQKLQPHILYLMPTQEKIVALTLDDGPHAHITPQLLDILQENHSRATWFIIGDHMDRCPGVVERIHVEGHEVGNHTMRDVASWTLSKEEFEEQLVGVDNRLKAYFRHDSLGQPLKWFRPGHGFYNSQIVSTCKAHGYQVALGSLYPMDHMFEKQAKLLVKNLLWRMHPGAVIILHDRAPQWEQTPQVLRMLLPELRKRGYKIVTLSELTNLQTNADAKRIY